MKKKYFTVALIISIILMLSLTDINKSFSQYRFYINLKVNINFIIIVLNKMLPLLSLIIIFISYKFLSSKWVFRVEKFNFGGISVICNNPEDIFKQQVKNYLNTKRTLFKIDEKKDNFYDTIGSYYEIYKFLRAEINVYDVKSSNKLSNNNFLTKLFKDEDENNQEEKNCYQNANEMIKKLNEFLTSHQSDLRRWYEYEVNKNINNIYNKSIDEIQRGYIRYEEIVNDFKEINNYFCSVAPDYEIDYKKWYGTDQEVSEGA